MKHLLILLGMLILLPLASTAETPASAPADAEAEYTRAIEKRAADTVAVLNLTDATKTAKVQSLIVAQYRALRDWHDANDPKLKDKAATTQAKDAVTATLKPLHDDFISKLSADLTAEQVEAVKDKMTYNVVKVTYDAYCDQIPQLTEPQKAHILAQLKEAREIAMDQGSSNEKHAVFGKYKGRINNFLAKEGYDLKQTQKEWAERRKARAAQAKE